MLHTKITLDDLCTDLYGFHSLLMMIATVSVTGTLREGIQTAV